MKRQRTKAVNYKDDLINQYLNYSPENNDALMILFKQLIDNQGKDFRQRIDEVKAERSK